jgi:hypothetical protein
MADDMGPPDEVLFESRPRFQSVASSIGLLLSVLGLVLAQGEGRWFATSVAGLGLGGHMLRIVDQRLRRYQIGLGSLVVRPPLWPAQRIDFYQIESASLGRPWFFSDRPIELKLKGGKKVTLRPADPDTFLARLRASGHIPPSPSTSGFPRL